MKMEINHFLGSLRVRGDSRYALTLSLSLSLSYFQMNIQVNHI